MPESPQNKGLFRPQAQFQSGMEYGSALPGMVAGNGEAHGGNNIAPTGMPPANGQHAPGTSLSSYGPTPGTAHPTTPAYNPNPAWSPNALSPMQPGVTPNGSNAAWNNAAPPIQQNGGWNQGGDPNGSQNNNWGPQAGGPPSATNWSQPPARPNTGQLSQGQAPTQQNAGPNTFNAPQGWSQPPARPNTGQLSQEQPPAQQNAGPNTFNAPQEWNQAQPYPNSGQNNSWGQPAAPQQNGGPNTFTPSQTWNQGPAYPNAAPSNNSWGQQAAYPGAVPNSPNNPWPASPQQARGSGQSWQPAAQANKKRGLREKYADLPTSKKAMLIVLLVAILIPSILVVFESINGYTMYSQARSGIQHLQNVQTLFSGGPKGNSAKYLDITKLRQAQVEVDAANSDFHQLSSKLDHDGSLSLLGSMAPKQINTARGLAHIGADATEIAQQGIKSAITLSPTLTPALSHPLGGGSSTQPIATPQVMSELGTDIDFILPRLHDMQQYSKGLDLTSLPLSDSQRKMINTALPLLPVGETVLTQVRSNMDVISWLLGVDQPRTFLVETMDRGELRATGGFTGQFGELEFNGGRMAPLSLKNIGQFEEDNRSTGSPLDPVFEKVAGQVAPAPFTWWPIPNFGMRDANLSADFPTSAKLIMNQYKSEFGKPVEGLILFSPFLISHVLQVTGPISVPEYKETITADNLETRLHYYQLDNVGIRQEELVEHVEDPQIARKLFTKRLSGLLLAKVQALPTDQMIGLGKEMLYAMKTKDLQVYFTNEKLEKLIGQYGSTAEIDRSTTHDGLFVVQANLSVSKASQYVTTTISDAVTLDAKGGATHMMKMRLVYKQLGSVYGLDTYRDYIRVYTPPNSQFISGTGFSHFGDPYCGGYYIACPQREDLFGTGEMTCPIGTKIGLIPALNDDPYGARLRPIDKIGAPLNMTSDEPGRNMFGSWVVVPKDCTMNISLSWYVPPIGHDPYNLVIQRQSSTLPNLDLTVKPASGTCTASKDSDLHYAHVQDGEDLSFTLANQSGGTCTLQTKPVQ